MMSPPGPRAFRRCRDLSPPRPSVCLLPLPCLLLRRASPLAPCSSAAAAHLPPPLSRHGGAIGQTGSMTYEVHLSEQFLFGAGEGDRWRVCWLSHSLKSYLLFNRPAKTLNFARILVSLLEMLTSAQQYFIWANNHI